MHTSIRIVRQLKLLIALGWVGLALAAEPISQITLKLPDNLSPWALIGIASFLSAWGGASFTVQRWAKGEDNTRWKVFLVRDAFCAQTAGFGTFFAAVYWRVDPPLVAIVVLVAGYGGSRVIDAALNGLEGFIQRKAVNVELPNKDKI